MFAFIEELHGVVIENTLIIKIFLQDSPYIWLNIAAFAKVAWLVLFTYRYEKPANEA